jgi:hypothetical protein
LLAVSTLVTAPEKSRELLESGMSLKEEIRVKAELRAASVLLDALMRQTEAQDLRRVFDNAVVRETAHMLERGSRPEAIRAFEDAAGEWAIRARRWDDESEHRGRERRTSPAQPRALGERRRRPERH